MWCSRDALKCHCLGISYEKSVMVMKGFYLASHFTLNTVYSRFLLSVQIYCLFSSFIVFQLDPLFFCCPNLCTFQHVVSSISMDIKTQSKLTIDIIINLTYIQMAWTQKWHKMGHHSLQVSGWHASHWHWLFWVSITTLLSFKIQGYNDKL